MRRAIFFLPLALLLSLASTAVAQFYVGGSFGFSTTIDNEKTKLKLDKTSPVASETSRYSFHFSPEVGYVVDPKVLVGATLSFARDRAFDGTEEAYQANAANSFSLAPHFQYTFLSVKGFGIYARAMMPVGYKTKSAETKLGKKTTTVDEPGVFSWGIGISPGLNYMINEHLLLFTRLDIFSLSYNLEVSSHENDMAEQTKTKHNFGIGLDGALMRKIGSISIGMSYSF